MHIEDHFTRYTSRGQYWYECDTCTAAVDTELRAWAHMYHMHDLVTAPTVAAVRALDVLDRWTHSIVCEVGPQA